MTEGRPVNNRILIVDEDASMREAFRRILAPVAEQESDDLDGTGFSDASSDAPPAHGFALTFASDGREALTRIAELERHGASFAVAFIDLRLPSGMDGVETVQRAWELDADMHVVICTAATDMSWSDVSAKLGRHDRLLLLRKPFDASEVWQLANSLCEKWSLQRRVRQRLVRSSQLTGELRVLNAALEREISIRQVVESELRENVFHDSLTGLPNRAFLMEFLAECIARATREAAYRYAVLFIDLDNFKLVNDSLGHECGDVLLVEVARRLSNALAELDSVARLNSESAARLGGDEFVVVLDGLTDVADAAMVAERLLDSLTEPFVVSAQKVTLGASIGIMHSDATYETADAVLRDADTAMYRAKSAGRSRYAIFDPKMHTAAKRRLKLENDMRLAIAEQHFSLDLQPIVSVGNGRIVSIEALVRWRHPDYEERMPAEFIGVAEETGLIVPLGEWVLLEALTVLARLRREVPSAADLRVNVNVSPRQLLDRDFPDQVTSILRRTGIAPSDVGLEITETVMMDDSGNAMDRLRDLERMGFSIHLDDFGTGYSALSCLHRFPLDVVKIDRAFIATMQENQDYASVIRAIVTLSHSLRMAVTVEGVETAEQYDWIHELGCDYAQGFYVARPMPFDDLKRFLTSGRDVSRLSCPV